VRHLNCNQSLKWSVPFCYSYLIFLFLMMVPIQIASQRSGVSAHVIRIWERRYQALVPNRTGTNRRMYSEEEVQRLKMLRELTERGHRIGPLAELPTEKLAHLLQEERVEQGGKAAVAMAEPERLFAVDASPALETTEDYVKACLAAAKGFEGDRLRRLLQRARLQFGQRGMLRQVVAPLIGQMGEAWQEGQMRPGQEHLGTAIIRELLLMPVPGSQTAVHAPELVVATPSGEVHEMGALLVVASARDLGWHVTYLGPNLPAEEIAHCARSRGARAVAVSVVYPDHSPQILQQIRELRKLLPEGISLLVGGRTAGGYRARSEDLQVEWVESFEGLDRLLVTLDRGQRVE
jgi:MerR family transcriptional regulator, light-induced transcriptional regulator